MKARHLRPDVFLMAGLQTPRQGFNLVELLVVIAIIAILASLVLPGISRSRQTAYKVVCLNNFRELGISIKLYSNDSNGRFPPAYVRDLGTNYSNIKSVQLALGGPDPEHTPCLIRYPRGTARPLYPYMRPSAVYRCPVDSGLRMLAGCRGHDIRPSNFKVVGCSYAYNCGNLTATASTLTRYPQAAPDGLAGKLESWVPDPARYILMYEPGGARGFT